MSQEWIVRSQIKAYCKKKDPCLARAREVKADPTEPMIYEKLCRSTRHCDHKTPDRQTIDLRTGSLDVDHI